jgi:RNA polymerase sigma-70 factor, ECF subfamily
MQAMSDEELMLKYQQGEIAVMDELLARYKNPVYHFALRLVRSQHEAQDIAQEVFLKVHQYRQSYVPTAKFSTWLFTICHNACISSFRKSKWLVFWPRQKDDPDELMDCESPQPSPQEIAAADDLATIVKENIQSLPFLQKEALILREYEQMDYAEIAKILGKPLGTVKILIHRARKTLKERLLPCINEGGLS